MKKALLAILLAARCFAALSANTAWEVRPTVGAATNGGGFVAAATGTDMSQYDNKNAAACSSCQSATGNISTTDAVAAGTTTITSATANFSSAIVGNIVYFQGGTGTIAAQWRQVATYTNATTIVIDTAIAASTGMTMNIGGSLGTPATIGSVAVSGNKIFVKDTGVLVTGAITLSANTNPGESAPASRLIGYTSVRTDGGLARFKLTGSSVTLLTVGNGWWLDNLDIDCNSQTASRGVFTNSYSQVNNLYVHNCHGYSIGNGNNYNLISNSTFGPSAAACGSSSSTPMLSLSYYTVLEHNYIHDSTCSEGAVTAYLYFTIEHNIFANISATIAANGTAIKPPAGQVTYGSIRFNTIYNTSGTALDLANTALGYETVVQGNIFDTIGGWCFEGADASPTGAYAAHPFWDGNAYYSCTSGNRRYIDDTGSLNAINGVSPYTNVLDKVLSASALTNPAAGNFSLNSNASGGQLLKGTAPSSCIGAVGHQVCTSYLDFGAVQSQYGTGSAGGGNFGAVQ